MEILKALLLIVGLGILAAITGELFRAYPIVFIIVWITIPISVTIFQYSKYSDFIEKRL